MGTIPLIQWRGVSAGTSLNTQGIGASFSTDLTLQIPVKSKYDILVPEKVLNGTIIYGAATTGGTPLRDYGRIRKIINDVYQIQSSSGSGIKDQDA